MKSTAPTPSVIFDRWLEQQPDSARVVLVCDTDRLLADAKVLDPSAVTDPQGRKWNLAVFRGDQVQFRRSFKTAQAGGRTIIGLIGPSQPDGQVDVSYLSDILSFQEGSPLDLSLPKYLEKFCPQISFPSRPLRHYRNALLARKEELASAGKKITSRWGKPDSWGRPQVAAMVLLAHDPTLSLENVWPDSDDPAEYVAHGLDLLLGRPELAHLRTTVLDLFISATLPAVTDSRPWFVPPPDEIAAFLLLFSHAKQAGLQNPVMQLVGAGLLPADTDWSEFSTLAPHVILQLQRRGAWDHIQFAADDYLTPKRVAKLLALTHPESAKPGDLVKAFAESQIVPVQRVILGRTIAAVIADPHSLHGVTIPPSVKNTEDGKIASGLAFLESWRRIERAISEVVLPAVNPAALLNAIAESAILSAETDLAGMQHAIDRFGDGDLIDSAWKILYGEGGTDLAPLAGSLKDQMRTAVHQWDELLAGFIRKSPAEFCKGGWCSIGYIHARLKAKVDSLSGGDGEGRAWVLVFDGMRYDTWQLVVRPLMAEHFQIVDDRPLFTVPPSYTIVARTSLLAGRLPEEWRGFQGQNTSDESALAAVNLGLTQQEAKTKFRLLKEVETIKARAKIGQSDKESRLVNVLIYGISDDCHDFHGDLAQFHQKIRTDILGNAAHGVAGILDDLVRRIKPGDEVVLVSDHGFTELLDSDGIVVAESECTAGKEGIHWRYALETCPSKYPDAVAVSAIGKEHFLAVGRKWFKRPGSNRKDRYAHGGISIAEMAVPAVTMRLATTKFLRLAIEALPEQIDIQEDAWWEGSISVVNRGTMESAFEITASTSMNERVFSESGSLKPGESRAFQFKLLGKYRETIQREIDSSNTLRAVTFCLTYSAGSGKGGDTQEAKVTVPVAVVPKATKLDTDALSGLDNI